MSSSEHTPEESHRLVSGHELEQFESSHELRNNSYYRDDSSPDSTFFDEINTMSQDSEIGKGVDADENEGMLGRTSSYEFSKDHSYGQSLSTLSKISRFFDGPAVPVEPKVTPIFKTIQYFPAKISSRWPYWVKATIIACFLSGWAFLFLQLAFHSILETPYVNGEPVPLLSCSATQSIWKGKNQRCGLNGELCGASQLKEFIFKCPAGCREDSHTWSETAVGNYSTIYRPYVIGTDNNYRADSFVCASAIHHGIGNNKQGFCGRIVFNGPQDYFGSDSTKSGITSLLFNSIFPYSYGFDDNFGAEFTATGCRDLRITIITVNIVLSFVFAYIVQNGAVFYWTFMTMGFWTVILGSNPPPLKQGTGELIAAELLSLGFRRFLPFMFGCYVIWMASARGQLLGLKENLSLSVLWVGGFWISLLENYTFSALPVNRLVISDINSQKGGWITVISIAGFILFAAFGQAYIIWRLGKFKRYITVYLLMITGLVILGTMRNETLRLHHYILGLVLLPGVGFKTTPSLLFLGLLIGLYISGVARWDFDSIIQTTAQLNRGDATNVGGLPELLGPLVEYTNSTGISSTVAAASDQISSVMLQWKDLLSGTAGVSPEGQAEAITSSSTSSDDIRKKWNGYSLLVNDIEQYRGEATNFSVKSWLHDSAWNTTQERNLYIRLAFANLLPSVDLTGGMLKVTVLVLLNCSNPN